MSSTSKEALLSCPTIPLNNGMKHPAIGFGTYKVGFIPASASSAVASSSSSSSATSEPKERTAKECVLDALEVGYRFLECAEFYGNEHQIGQAIQESGVAREDLFLCSKVWTTTIEQGPQAVRDQLEQTLKDLQTPYLDLYCIHWPVPHKHVEAYQTLETLHKEGKIKALGISNYAWEDYQELKPHISIKPVINQIEINPFLYRPQTIANFQNEGVVLQSYRSLRDGKAMQDSTLQEIASHYPPKTVAQLLGRWCVQHGFVYIPKSVKKERMIENAQVFDFEISTEDMKVLDSLTTPETLQTFKALYEKCVNRDTSKDGTMDGVKTTITLG